MPKKRANGEGSIRKRKDGRWEGFYTASYDPESGKQKGAHSSSQKDMERKTRLCRFRRSRNRMTPKIKDTKGMATCMKHSRFPCFLAFVWRSAAAVASRGLAGMPE